ncbi:pseudouridylate synthase 1 homolog isoform X2 [Zophobas morio]|uniref:pseudouridylate synthase 1 homolog isoform X2 n=1 Tax=Zophobas morio TaxID=2755281 RepID=UPI003082C4BE
MPGASTDLGGAHPVYCGWEYFFIPQSGHVGLVRHMNDRDDSSLICEGSNGARKCLNYTGYEENSTIKRFKKIPKRKVALLLSYSGAKYYGMQRNPGVETIESKLHEALVKAGAISPWNADSLSKISFQRCARTDKGVSARENVVSLKVHMTDNLQENINNFLPPDIRVMGIQRCTKSFNSKNQCTARLYDYILPTFSFAKSLHLTNDTYRICQTTLTNIRRLLKVFVGTHNFHNYTSGKEFTDASAIRFIMDFTCAEPFVMEGVEFIRLSIKGQSFMIHQIRKMIGLVISIVRGLCAETYITKTFSNLKVHVPKAPGLGLLLRQVFFTDYNRKCNNGSSGGINWDSSWEALEEFENKVITPHIITTEKQEGSMGNWLIKLYSSHDFCVPENETCSSVQHM